MRCAIVTRAGQVMAKGTLVVRADDSGIMRLNFHTNSGRWIEGGQIPGDGDLTDALEGLFRQCFEVWGMTGLKLTVSN